MRGMSTEREKTQGKKWTTAAKKKVRTSERGKVELMGEQQTVGTRSGEKAMKGWKKIKDKTPFLNEP